MRNTKRVIAQFTFYDRTGIQKYLETMAQKGWMLEKITNWYWQFGRIEPRNIHFAVSYFAKTSSFAPEPGEELLRFREFCDHSGWTFVAEAAQMQIFCNSSPDPVPIETDALLEIDSIHRGVKKQLLPAYITLMACALLEMALYYYQLFDSPSRLLRSNFALFSLLCWPIIFAMCALEVFTYFHWRKKALAAATLDGGFVPTRSNRNIVLTLSGLIYLILVYVVASCGWSLESTAMILGAGYMFFLMFAVQRISAFLKRRKASAGANFAVTLISAFVLAAALIGGVTWLVTGLSDSEIFKENNDSEYSYTIGNTTYNVYEHILPLYIDDIYDVEGREFSNWKNASSSVFMNYVHATILELFDEQNFANRSSLSYTYIEVKLPFLYGLIERELFKSYTEPKYYSDLKTDLVPVDPAPWKADEAWQFYYLGTPYYSDYIVRWGSDILCIFNNETLTEEQMAIIADKLQKN